MFTTCLIFWLFSPCLTFFYQCHWVPRSQYWTWLSTVLLLLTAMTKPKIWKWDSSCTKPELSFKCTYWRLFESCGEVQYHKVVPLFFELLQSISPKEGTCGCQVSVLLTLSRLSIKIWPLWKLFKCYTKLMMIGWD